MGCRVSFTLVLTLLTLILSLVPAVIIWVVFMDLMTASVELLQGTTRAATDVMAQRIQELLMQEAMDSLNARLTEGDKELLAQLAIVQASGLLDRDLRPARFDVVGQFLAPYQSRNFGTMTGHPYFCNINTIGALYRNGTDAVATRLFWINWLALFVDACRGTVGNRTLYLSTMAMAPDGQNNQLNSSCVDQVTSLPLRLLSSRTVPSATQDMLFAANGWDTELSFSSYTGQVQLTKWHWLPAQNDTWIQVSLSISAETISAQLLAQLRDSPDDRLVLFFRQPEGYMLAASHGKYWSHSDTDRRYLNPLTNPPNVSAYSLWTCLQSTDALIQLACAQLYATYQSWTAIPRLRLDAVLSGRRYWVATDFSTASLQCTVLMLKDRASVMGQIDASNAQVGDRVTQKKGVTFVILGVISAAAVLLPLGVGVWLASRLNSLASGMDRIAQLQFTATAPSGTVFSELHRFQTSFVQMERGLQAFGKFVPQAVVKVLVAGQMHATDDMHPETLTILFADIEGFSTICENVPPGVLVAVCTEYFEAMCSNIAQRHGTIDKFIGDCIMAIWNAPERQPGHEREAVAAALAMQASVMELHHGWHRRGQPILKFRLGLHTGLCLVGNFGCSYRVSYTCLGDGVNLAARLEALNKRFGTYLCVSHATYEACRWDFHFRRLARVTVPGKAEVVPVYEVLCSADGPLSPTLRSEALGLPGSTKDRIVEAMETVSLDRSVTTVSGIESPKSKCWTSSRTVETTDAGRVPYHWAYVDRTALLQQTREYEQAYAALVAGDRAEAEQLLAAEPLLAVPDRAWTILADQLTHPAGGPPWDGVFHFREK